jgi:hypothetical protein
MKDRDQTTTTSDERGPLAPFQQTGISPNVKAELGNELGKLTPSIAARIRAELEKKRG